MKVSAVAFSAQGLALAQRLRPFFQAQGWQLTSSRCPEGGLDAWTQAHFSSDALLFISSCGIAVRALAPYLTNKTKDPAVVVIDETASYAVSLLSGHIGGANRLAAALADYLDAVPVITTATDVRGLFAVDAWATEQGLGIANPQRIKGISGRLLAGETIRLKSDFPIDGALPPGFSSGGDAWDVLITYRTRGRSEALRLVPPVVTLGVGCKKDTGLAQLEQAYQLILNRAGCHPLAVKQVCSIDLKAREPGLLQFCRRHQLPFRTFSASQLAALPGSFSSSAFVQAMTGVDNVCERSALLGSGPLGKLLAGKDGGPGITMALAIEPYTVNFGN